jgi:transposase
MQTITTIGLDIAKSVFQVHGVDADGNIVIRRQVKRRYVPAFSRSCRRALSASKPAPRRIIGRANSRRLAIPFRLMPPAYVKPYVKRHKNDATDAEAICEAVTRTCGSSRPRRQSNRVA